MKTFMETKNDFPTQMFFILVTDVKIQSSLSFILHSNGRFEMFQI